MYISRSVERFEALSLVSLTRVRQSDKKHNSTLVRILLRETVPVLIFTIIIVETSVFVLFLSFFLLLRCRVQMDVGTRLQMEQICTHETHPNGYKPLASLAVPERQKVGRSERRTLPPPRLEPVSLPNSDYQVSSLQLTAVLH